MECDKSFQDLVKLIGGHYWEFICSWKREFPRDQMPLLQEVHKLFPQLTLYELHRLWKNA